MSTTKKIIAVLKELDANELHEICRECNGYDGSLDWLCWEAFDEEFFEVFFKDPIEAARATFFGSIQNWSDNWIRFNAYGNLESAGYLYFDDFEPYLEDIADAIERLYGKIWLPREVVSLFEDDAPHNGKKFACPDCGEVVTVEYDSARCASCGWFCGDGELDEVLEG